MLLSLVAATVAVLMSRRSTPEHLVLISFTIGAAGAAAAACYRMLAPLTTTDAALLNERRSERRRAAIEREKALVLRSIKELEFDRAMGKVSAKDFDEMAGRLRARALMLMKQVDAGGSGYRELIERELSLRMTMRVKAPEVRLKPDTDRAQRPADQPDATETPDPGPRPGSRSPESRAPIKVATRAAPRTITTRPSASAAGTGCRRCAHDAPRTFRLGWRSS